AVEQTGRDLRAIEDIFRQATVHQMVAVMKNLGESTFKGVNEDMKEVLQMTIKGAEEEREKLLAGKPTGIYQELRQKVLSVTSKEYKRRLDETMGDADNFTTRLKELEMIILENKTLLGTGYEFSDEALTRYVESITDPKSILYVGAQNVYNENS